MTARRAATPGQAAAQSWSQQALILVAGRPEASVTPLAGKGLDSAQLTIYAPDALRTQRTLSKENGRWRAAPLAEGLGGFHWLSSRAFGETEIRSAASVLMFPGKGPSPEKLLSDYQMGLDIRPVRLPERGGYREGSRWDFLVRFDGLPLAATTLLLETENGSSEKFETNQQGIAHVTFPRDFDSASIDKEAGAARTRKGFAVSAVWEGNGVRHSSAFNYFYTPDLMRERSLAWGMGFTLLGMCLAFPLLRRKETVHV